MEAVPRLPMLSFELKTSEEKANFLPKLKDYIQYHYNEDAESFSNQINQMEGLRASACRPTKDIGGCATLKRYYCQLHFLISRFPMGKGGDAAVKFTWKDPYSDVVVSAADVIVELASILYNIGALHTQLGASDNRSTAEGMKMACSHFQCAAWAFQHIPEEFPEILSYDTSTDLLTFMNHICLAQAQECILEKSMLDNRKATIIAKVAVQTVDYYKQALKKMSSNASSSDDPSITETIGAKLKKKWEAYLKFKISYYGCIGLLYQGQQSEEQQKMGERVAFYQAALDKLEEARKLSKGSDNIAVVNEALQFTQDVVEGKRKAAKNENEFIYHEEVPDVSALPDIKGASLVKGISFSVNDVEISGPDIFGRLIPLKAHETSSIYSEELAKLQRKVTADVLKAERDLEIFLSMLRIEELRAHEKWELPQEIVDRCAALSVKPDAIQNLLDAMDSLSATYQDVEEMLGEIRSLLQKEEEDVQGYEDVVGKRPPSIAATDLTREAMKYQDAHAKASESNITLHNAMHMHVANLRLLTLPIRELRERIPQIAIGSQDDDASLKQMEILMNKVKEMKQQRGVLVAQLREAINRDDITQKVVTYNGESEADLFRQEIGKHEGQVNLINQNIAAQSKIIAAIQEHYGRYDEVRRIIHSQLQRRDAMVAGLIASYDAYEDLIAKSNKGLEFYKKLQGNVSRLLQRVKSTCKVQEEEREQILSSILEDVPRSARGKSVMNNERIPVPASNDATPPVEPLERTTPPARVHNDLGNSTSGGLKLKDYLNMKKETGKMSLVSTSVAFSTTAYPAVVSPQPPAAWVPGVRPAPVGSEESDPVMSRQPESGTSYTISNVWPTNPDKHSYYQTYSDVSNNPGYNASYKYYANNAGQTQQLPPPTTMTSYDYNAPYVYNPQIYQDGTTAPTQVFLSNNYQDPTASLPAHYNTGNSATYSSQNYSTDPNTVPSSVPLLPYSGLPTRSTDLAAVPSSTVCQSYYTNTSTVPPSNYPQNFTPNSVDPSFNVNVMPQPYTDPYAKEVPYGISSAYNTANAPSLVSSTANLPQQPPYPYSVSTQQQPQVPEVAYSAGSTNVDTYAAQNNYYPSTNFPTATPVQGVNGVYPPEGQQNQTLDITMSEQMVSTYQAPGNWTYIPQQGGSYNQDAGYAQYGNASLYTQTQQPHTFNPTSSELYYAAPKQPDVKPETWQSPVQSEIQFIPYPGTNSATQSPVTYRQAGFNDNTAATVTTSSADNARPASSVKTSNLDLLAGLEFDVTQSPLVPQTQTKTSPVKVPPVIQPTKHESVQNKVEDVAVKKEPDERRMDVDALKAFAPEVEKLKKFVEGLTLKTLNGPTALDVKWKEIMDAQEKDCHHRSISVARCYPMKNRFPDILPYDESRIELPSTKDDYINASIMKSLTPGIVPLILTQAPMPVTYGDFWTMVVEQQVEVVVCLLGDAELGGHVYWPEDKAQDLTLGRLRLSLQTCNVRSHWVERILSLTVMDSKVTRVVVHLQFTAWPGSSFPASPAPFLNFVQEVKTFFQQQRSGNHPAVIHCLSGVGRSGLLCAVLAAVIDIETGRGIPDLVAVVARMSQARKNSFRDREHLKFAYQSVLYFCQDLLLKRGILTNVATLEDSRPKDGKCHTRHPSQDYLVPSETEILQSKFEVLNVEDATRSEVNKKPVTEQSQAGELNEANTTPQLLAAMDPKAFNLSTQDSKSMRTKQKFTPESFNKPNSSTSLTVSADKPSDPLSSLDPLWSLKK